MVVVPPVVVVRIPVAEPTAAMPVLLLAHTPPVARSVNVVVMSAQMAAVFPKIPEGLGFTVTVAVLIQPAGSV